MISTTYKRGEATGKVSSSYKVIETADITAQLHAVLGARGLLPRATQDSDFTGYSVRQAGVRGGGTTHALTYTLHGLRTSVNGDVITPTIHIVNSYGGERAFQITVGFFRMICSNGMIVGTAFFNQRIVHRSGATFDRKLAEVAEGMSAAIEYIATGFRGDMERLAATEVTTEGMWSIMQQLGLSKSRLGFAEGIVKNAEARRMADRQNNLWTLWNIANETMRRNSRSELRQVLVNNDLLDRINTAHAQLTEAA